MVSIDGTTASPAMFGAATLPQIDSGDISTRISSHRESEINESSTVAPPSTRSDVIPFPYNEAIASLRDWKSLMTMVSPPSLSLIDGRSRRLRRSSTTFKGDRPAYSRVSSDGLSLKAVPLPTRYVTGLHPGSHAIGGQA